MGALETAGEAAGAIANAIALKDLSVSMRRPLHASEVSIFPHQPTESMSSNFYKINWRVLGGGVKIGSESERI